LAVKSESEENAEKLAQARKAEKEAFDAGWQAHMEAHISELKAREQIILHIVYLGNIWANETYDCILEDEQGNRGVGNPWHCSHLFDVIATSPAKWAEMRADPRLQEFEFRAEKKKALATFVAASRSAKPGLLNPVCLSVRRRPPRLDSAGRRF
jgi:hypothetical protein